MIVEIKNISKRFTSSQFELKDISFSIQKQESIGIIGENGSGKSTILKMLNYLVPYDSGSITYDDKNINELSENELRKMRKEIVYIFQNANLLENKTVLYHLALVYKLNNKKVNFEEIEEVLSLIDMKHLKKQYCCNLSGGQKQRVAIAMALLQKPKILLCDEISAALDAKSEQEIFELLSQIQKTQKIALVIVSHNLAILKNMCSKILLVSNQTISETIIPNKSIAQTNTHSYENYIKEYFNA